MASFLCFILFVAFVLTFYIACWLFGERGRLMTKLDVERTWPTALQQVIDVPMAGGPADGATQKINLLASVINLPIVRVRSMMEQPICTIWTAESAPAVEIPEGVQVEHGHAVYERHVEYRFKELKGASIESK